MSPSGRSTRASPASSSSRRANIQLLSSLALGTTLLLLLSQSCRIAEGSPLPRPQPQPLLPFPFTFGASFNTSFAQQLAITKLQNKINILDVLIAKYPVNSVSTVNTVNTATVSTVNTGR